MSKTQYTYQAEKPKKPAVDKILTFIFIAEQIALMIYVFIKKGQDIVDFFFR